MVCFSLWWSGDFWGKMGSIDKTSAETSFYRKYGNGRTSKPQSSHHPSIWTRPIWHLTELFLFFRKGEQIYEQLRSLGASLDWSRACFTMDPVRPAHMCRSQATCFMLALYVMVRSYVTYTGMSSLGHLRKFLASLGPARKESGG